MTESTDPDRRLALQLALQLPENIDRARRVLALTEGLLDQHLIEPSPAHQRALLLGWGARVAPVVLPALPGLGRPRVIAESLAWLAMGFSLGLIVFALFGAGALVTMGFFAVVVSLLFGELPGVIVAVLATAINNLLLVPPAWEFSAPTKPEIMVGVFLVAVTLVAPSVARHSPLRQLDPRRQPDPDRPFVCPDNVEPLRQNRR